MTIPGLTAKQLSIVQACIPNGVEYVLFGSRVRATFRDKSDLDVCILSDIPRNKLSDIREAFEESDLPFMVDVVLYKDCSAEFKQVIDATSTKCS